MTLENRKKFDIVYKNFAKPICDMKEIYQSSALTVNNHVISPKVSKAFDVLFDALKEQLNSYRE